MPKPSDPSQHEYMFSDDMKFLQKVVVYHPDNNKTFLVLKRSMHHKYRPGDWDLPGGNVIYGEDALESLKREVVEESGLSIHDLKPISVITNPTFENNIYLLVINYKAIANRAEIKLSHEHTEYKWVGIEEFKTMTQAAFLQELVSALQ